MAVLWKSKIDSFFNSAGRVRSGGKVLTFLTGSSTPLATYSDDGLTTANLTTITLDSAGRSPVDLYLSDNDYKITVTNSDGTDSITVDPVHGANPARNAFTLFNGSTGNPTSSSTKVMQGFGAVWALTPTRTGKVRITVTGFATNTLLGNAKINANYGTGSAPASGAALTGTAFCNTDILATSAESALSPAVPFTFNAEAIGLTLNVALWFDMTLGSSSGSSTLTYTSVIIQEF